MSRGWECGCSIPETHFMYRQRCGLHQRLIRAGVCGGRGTTDQPDIAILSGEWTRDTHSTCTCCLARLAAFAKRMQCISAINRTRTKLFGYEIRTAFFDRLAQHSDCDGVRRRSQSGGRVQRQSTMSRFRMSPGSYTLIRIQFFGYSVNTEVLCVGEKPIGVSRRT